MPLNTPAPGTIPALTPYQPDALPISGQELVEIASSGNATTAVSGSMLITDVVGKAPSAMPLQTTIGASDLVAIYSPTTGQGYSYQAINFGSGGGGGTTGLTTTAGLSVLGVAGVASAIPAAITGTANQVLVVNSAGNLVNWGQVNLASNAAVTGFLQPGNMATATATSLGIVQADGTSITNNGGVLTAVSAGNVVASAALTTGFAIIGAGGVNISAVSVLSTSVLPVGSTTAFGIMRADGATISATGGVLTALTGGAGNVIASATLATHGVLVGNGGAFTKTIATVGINGSVLLGSTSADPAFQVVSGDGTITNAGALTITATNGSAFGALATAVVTAGTNGQVFLSSTGAVPAFKTISGDGSITNTGVLSVSKIGGTSLVLNGTNGQFLLGSTNAAPAFQTMSGDGTVTNAGVLTITKTNGVAFAASATTNALNASNINAGTIGTSFLPIATTNIVGVVRPDGTSITISGGGVLSAVTGGSGNVNATALTPNAVVIGTSALGIATITTGSNGQVLLGSTSAPPAFQTVSGDGSITNAGVLSITKIGGTSLTLNGTNGQVLLGSTNAAPAFQTVSGDGTITNAGVLSVTKINGTSISLNGTNGQFLLGSTGASPAFQTMSGDGTVTNTGVLSITKIGGTSIALNGTNGQLLIASTNAAPAWKAVSGDVTINNAGVATVGSIGGTSFAIPVTVANGGSGTTTLTARAVLLGGTNATATLGFATIGTSGQILIDQGAGANPAFKAVSGDVTITNLGTATLTSNVARLNVQNQALSGGAVVTSFNAGNIQTSTFTVACGTAPLAYVTNHGAGTVAAPTQDGSVILMVTNSTNAGPLTFSGFNVGSNTGDTYTTSSGSVFSLFVWRVNGTSGYRWAAHQ